MRNSGELRGTEGAGALFESEDVCFESAGAVNLLKASMGALIKEKNPLSCSLLGFGTERSVDCACYS